MENILDTGRCACKKVQFSVKAKPLLRLYCHCRYCQSFNAAAFADVMIFRYHAVDMPSDKDLTFQRYRRILGVQRGKCRECMTPVVEYLYLPFGLSLAIVPSKILPLLREKEAALYHLYYHQRVKSVDDELPKYKGHWPSQLSLAFSLLKALLLR